MQILVSHQQINAFLITAILTDVLCNFDVIPFNLIFPTKPCRRYLYQVSIYDTPKFPSMLSSIPPLQDDEEDVSYDLESLFTNILLQETINYIIEQIYVHKKLMPICLKLIFRRSLIKLATECTFKLNNRFLKQVDGCTMGGPLSVTFSDIWSKWKMML